jgi:protein gp37
VANQRNGGIAWTDCTWNPLRGCSKVSSGCQHCYAEMMAARFSGPGMPFEGVIENGHWNGKIRVAEEKLDDPLRWKKPRRVFVNSVSDLFHSAVPLDMIDRIWATMLLGHKHQYQVLTKRPAEMCRYLSDTGLYARVLDAANRIRVDRPNLMGISISDPTKFPVKWIHLLTSCENQATADERIPDLLACPAAVRGVSLEPLLGPIDLSRYMKRGAACECDPKLPPSERCNSPNTPPSRRMLRCRAAMRTLDWVIVGCESGRNRRACEIGWIHSIVRQCREYGVPVFVKQLEVNCKVTSDINAFPEWARVRMFPGDQY